LSYYVKAMTRGEKGSAKGSPTQAMDYLTDGHDQRRDPAFSDGEVQYIARMGEGWKTEQEGGKVPMVGYGRLDGIQDQAVLREAFEDGCQPEAHSLAKGAKTGYLSLVMTLPKEVSLYAEGNREQAKEAMYAAVKESLEKAFPGKDITAVAAIHTRNENGEIHYHVHVLVAKFARDKETGKSYSLNSKRGGNTGKERLEHMKEGWKSGVEKEFKERLNLGIEQHRANGPVTLHLPDGAKLAPLNRESRRQLEKQLEPTFTRTTPTGEVKQSKLKLNEMDDRIFEIASGDRGKSGWNLQAFKEAFPDQAKFAGRYEKRVEVLRQVGYLNSEGRITQDFRNHFAAKNGQNTPELQRLRIELAREATKQAQAEKRPVLVTSLWEAVQKSDAIRRRVERLGFNEKDIQRITKEAGKCNPSRATLDRIRLEAEYQGRKQAAEKVQKGILPQTKTVTQAFLDLQKARIQRTYLSAVATLRADFVQRKMEADKLVRSSEYALRNAKEKRIAQVEKTIRPAFRAVKFLMPKTAARLEKARAEMVRIATYDETKALKKEAMDRMYSTWKAEYVERPLSDLQEKARIAGHEQAKEMLSRVVVLEERKPGAVGTLVEHGQAPYNFKADEKDSYFVKIKTQNGEEKTLWGVDLNRAIEESGVKTGDRIRLENTGKQTVTVDAPVRNDEGKIIAFEKRESQRNTWEITPERDRAANLDRETRQFVRGMAELEKHRPEEAQRLTPWKGNEAELVALTIQKAKGEPSELQSEVYDSAVKAGKIGIILEKEENSKPLSIPRGLEREAEDLQKISARFDALGIKNPFNKESLTNSAPAEIRKAIDRCKESGLTDEGAGWAFKGGQLRGIAQDIEKGLGKDIDATKHLTDNLMQRKQA